VVQLDVNVQAMQCHALVATGRKYLRGPRGTGLLYVSDAVVNNLTPHHCDHYSMPVQSVPRAPSSSTSFLQQPLQNNLAFAPRPGAQRFEFWESSIANKLGLGVAAAEAIGVGLETIAAATQARALYLYDQLVKLAANDMTYSNRQLHLYHRPESGIVTFWVHGVESTVLKNRMWGDDTNVQFEVAVVPATSTPIDSSDTGVPDLLRASVSYTNTEDEIDLFCGRLRELLQTI